MLRLGVNKLGDSDRKVASKVSYLLLDVEQVHPAMKSVVINAISELLFRTQDYHARYYSVITLNQTILTHKETEVANSLVKVYLMLFERLLTEWQKTKDFSTSHTPTEKVKKPRWKNKGGKGKKGGERQIQKTADTIKEEEVQRLTLAILSGLNRAYPFSELPREIFDKYLDSFYRVTHSANFNTSVQALTFIFQVSKSEKSLSDRYFRTLYESLLDPRLAVSSKLRLYLNLLFKSLREDDNITRLNAFVKRLLQMALHWLNIGIVASSLYLVAELKKFVPQLNNLIALPNNQVKNTSLSETHKEMSDAFYDGRARDPLYAHAVDVNLWELIPLLDHFHPTIKVYAEGLVNNIFLGRPDLSLHTLSHFLDRFVYKNPKQKVALKGTSIMQPLAGTTNGVTSSTTRKGIPANITDWSKVNLSEIDASEKFFYQYFTTRGERPLKEKHDKTQFGEFNEDEVWNALVHSKPEVEDDIEESDFSEFDYEDFSDEDDVEDMDEKKLLREVDEEESEPYSDFDKQSDKDEPSLIEEDISEGEESHDEVDDSNESGDEFIDEILNDLNDSDVSVYTNSSNEGVNIEDDQKELSAMANKKKRRSKEDTSSEKSKRQKIKELPTFASVDDYAKYLESSDEDYS